MPYTQWASCTLLSLCGFVCSMTVITYIYISFTHVLHLDKHLLKKINNSQQNVWHVCLVSGHFLLRTYPTTFGFTQVHDQCKLKSANTDHFLSLYKISSLVVVNNFHSGSLLFSLKKTNVHPDQPPPPPRQDLKHQAQQIGFIDRDAYRTCLLSCYHHPWSPWWLYAGVLSSTRCL